MRVHSVLFIVILHLLINSPLLFKKSNWQFSRIRTKYGEIPKYLSVFSPNAGKCGKNADQNNSEYGHFLRSESYCFIEKQQFLKLLNQTSVFIIKKGPVDELFFRHKILTDRIHTIF